MVARWFALAVLSLAAGLVVFACSGGPYSAACGEAEGCVGSTHITDQSLPDCSEGPCKCLDAAQAACCPFGWQSCNSDLLKCRPKAECGIEDPECESDADCPGPPDYRCGQGRCAEGKCELDIRGYEIIPNQYPGDCKYLYCSPQGDVVAGKDPGDIPDDGEPCTFDTCEEGEPVNIVLPDEHVCPGDTDRVCWKGKCRECYESFDEVCPNGLLCCYLWCAPWNCQNAAKDGQETGMDCGGPDCPPCGDTGKCLIASDCLSGVCQLGKCQFPSPSDGVKNGQETGVDCGHPGGPPCNDGEGCTSESYCKSGVCYKATCQKPSCTDSIKNGTETSPDCGGECSPCPN